MLDYENLLEDFKDFLIGVVLLLHLPAIDDIDKLYELNEEELLELCEDYDFDVSQYYIGEIDYEKLKNDLKEMYKDYYPIFNFSILKKPDFDNMSKSELIGFARNKGIDIKEYEKDKKLTK